MDSKQIEQQISQINQRLDFITKYLQEQQRRQQEWDELKGDLTVIGKDVFQTAVKELDEISYHFDTADLMYLLKKLLRNTRNMTKMIDQVESVTDFVHDAAPLGKHILDEVMENLSELERKGYFEFGREAFKILDTIVTSFKVEDVQLLRENITSILLTLRNLTQPQMLSSVNNALSFFQKMDVVVDQKVSYWTLLKELRDPELKRGLAFIIQFMKNMVKTNGIKIADHIEPKNFSITKED
ncbi:MAG: hypothetical protein A2Y71_08075 [Bacteroidetes bacterium RBG_13_42_15]|nr:MAG: hypothetical protein A2Y71_08075 [Bacteroidetes bacterium RBG_13_42_15]